jgi:hypothetical protein
MPWRPCLPSWKKSGPPGGNNAERIDAPAIPVPAAVRIAPRLMVGGLSPAGVGRHGGRPSSRGGTSCETLWMPGIMFLNPWRWRADSAFGTVVARAFRNAPRGSFEEKERGTGVPPVCGTWLRGSNVFVMTKKASLCTAGTAMPPSFAGRSLPSKGRWA